jgi:hypothetical protein
MEGKKKKCADVNHTNFPSANVLRAAIYNQKLYTRRTRQDKSVIISKKNCFMAQIYLACVSFIKLIYQTSRVSESRRGEVEKKTCTSNLNFFL